MCINYVNNINRDYNPITGRYIQSDPIGLDGGSSTFAYVNGNPVMLVDLEGLFGSQVAPTPVIETADERQSKYINMMTKLLKDIRNSTYVASDIRRLQIMLFYNDSFFNVGNGDVLGRATRGGVNMITMWRGVWETEYGKKSSSDQKTQLVDTMFHELEHLRKANLAHGEYFNQVYRQQKENFYADRYGNQWR